MKPWWIAIGVLGAVIGYRVKPPVVVAPWGQPVAPVVQPVMPPVMPPATDERQQFRAVQEAKIDVNHANAAELEALVGVGPVIAAEIVAYREAHGPFQKPEDLLPVMGIGPKKLMAMAPQLLFK